MATKPELYGTTPSHSPANGGTVYPHGIQDGRVFATAVPFNGYHFVRWNFTLSGNGSATLRTQMATQASNASFSIVGEYIDSNANSLILYAEAIFDSNTSPTQPSVCGVVATAVGGNITGLGGGTVKINDGTADICVTALIDVGDQYTLTATADQGYMFTKWVSQYGDTSFLSTVTSRTRADQPGCAWWAYFIEKESGTGKILRRASNGVILRAATSGMMLRKGTV